MPATSKSTSLTEDETEPFDLMRITLDSADLDLPIDVAPAEAERMLHGEAPDPDHAQVYMSRAALLQVQEHAMSNTRVELGGVLLGRAFQHNGMMIVCVEGAMAARSDENGPVHFTFTHESWSGIHEDRAQMFPTLDIVGWFHTHPDLGVFYSADDEVVHSAAFVQPWHVGLVVDPVRSHASYFGWVADNKLKPLAGYYELHEGEEQSAVKWRNKVDNSWFSPMMSSYDGTYYHNGAAMANNSNETMLGLSLFFSVVAALTSVTALILVLMRNPG